MVENAHIKILITDDHRLFRHSLRMFLQSKSNLRVIGEAENGQVAVRKARELHPDVVLMDVRMPVLGGIDATRQIKQCCPDIDVIALTNQTEDYFIDAMRCAGAADYLTKSSHPNSIVTSIRNAYSKNGSR